MKLKLKHEDALEKATSGITRVAQAIVGIPAEQRLKALGAVERSYRKIATDLGFREDQARGWAAAIMASLRAELEKRLAAKSARQMPRKTQTSSNARDRAALRPPASVAHFSKWTSRFITPMLGRTQ
jgi:hypothetical protein